MAKVKLTKTVVEAQKPTSRPIELRDLSVPGFMCKVTPAGHKVFMIQYRTNSGVRRKPAIGQYGELTVEQARDIARGWLAEVRRGGDPSADRSVARSAPDIEALCERYLADHCIPHNKPSTIRTVKGYIKTHIIPTLGSLKVPDVTRVHVSALFKVLEPTPVTGNRVVACLRKMFNLAEAWGLRPDGTNPCRHIDLYPEKGSTRLMPDAELAQLYAYLDKADAEGLEHSSNTLAIRLQFEFAGRMSEIRTLEWAWIDFASRRIVWPDSKTGDISKPLTENAIALLKRAPRSKESRFVCPAVLDSRRCLPATTYYGAWTRILKRCGIPHVGTHGIRHRSTTDIANSGIPVKVGMALTAHKTVTMFMRYVHVEDDPVRAAADLVTKRRTQVVGRRS